MTLKSSSGKSHGRLAIIMKNNIKHHLRSKITFDYLQATTVSLYTLNRPLQMSPIYSSPKHKLTSEQYEIFFQTLGNKFLVAGDYNANQLMGIKKNIIKRENSIASDRKIVANPALVDKPTYWSVANDNT